MTFFVLYMIFRQLFSKELRTSFPDGGGEGKEEVELPSVDSSEDDSSDRQSEEELSPPPPAVRKPRRTARVQKACVGLSYFYSFVHPLFNFRLISPSLYLKVIENNQQDEASTLPFICSLDSSLKSNQKRHPDAERYTLIETFLRHLISLLFGCLSNSCIYGFRVCNLFTYSILFSTRGRNVSNYNIMNEIGVFSILDF